MVNCEDERKNRQIVVDSDADILGMLRLYITLLNQPEAEIMTYARMKGSRVKKGKGVWLGSCESEEWVGLSWEDRFCYVRRDRFEISDPDVTFVVKYDAKDKTTIILRMQCRLKEQHLLRSNNENFYKLECPTGPDEQCDTSNVWQNESIWEQLDAVKLNPWEEEPTFTQEKKENKNECIAYKKCNKRRWKAYIDLQDSVTLDFISALGFRTPDIAIARMINEKINAEKRNLEFLGAFFHLPLEPGPKEKKEKTPPTYDLVRLVYTESLPKNGKIISIALLEVINENLELGHPYFQKQGDDKTTWTLFQESDKATYGALQRGLVFVFQTRNSPDSLNNSSS